MLKTYKVRIMHSHSFWTEQYAALTDYAEDYMEIQATRASIAAYSAYCKYAKVNEEYKKFDNKHRLIITQNEYGFDNYILKIRSEKLRRNKRNPNIAFHLEETYQFHAYIEQ